jgi:asparagine synthase (glutamine-hydrolysing)
VLTAKRHKLLAVLEAERPGDLYRDLRSDWPAVDDLVAGTEGCAPLPESDALDVEDVRLLAMYLDMTGFLPEHPLTKADRATMAVGLEARVPLLDRDVIEFAWRLPVSQRLRAGATKYLLRNLLYRYVPPELIERPKVGFAVPIADWLRGPLRAWAEPLIDPDRLRAEGYLNASRVQAVWQAHLAGKQDWKHALWDVLTFQAWLETVNAR